MANVSDFANNAAAVAAGYSSVSEDRGAVPPSGLRYRRYYEGQVTASTGGQGDGVRIDAIGESNVDQATADAAALASLNAQRRHYFGGSPGRASGSSQSQGSRGEAHNVK